LYGRAHLTGHCPAASSRPVGAAGQGAILGAAAGPGHLVLVPDPAGVSGALRVSRQVPGSGVARVDEPWRGRLDPVGKHRSAALSGWCGARGLVRV